MTLDEFIAWLQDFRKHGVPGTAIVRTWCLDAGEDIPVTGVLYDDETFNLLADSESD